MHTDRRVKKTIEEIIGMTPEEICSDREIFDELIYTDIDTAMKELHRRREDPELEKKVKEFLGEIPLPEPLKEEPRAVMFRQIATPNYETSRFLMAADGIDMKPLFFEIYDDKFTPENELKKYLLKLIFHTGIGKNNGPKIDTETIADIHVWSGKKFKEINTFWNQSLIDFHHQILKENYPEHKIDNNLFDGSKWLNMCGNGAKDYYYYFFGLFIKNSILFENFVISKKGERDFINNIVIHSFIKVYNYFGIKPIIVALEPTDIEGELFWECHNTKTMMTLDKIKK